MNKPLLVGLGLAVLVAAAIGFLVLRQPGMPTPSAPARPASVPPPVLATPATPAADCLRPGPAPVPPQGSTATADDMKLGHDTIQHFVEQLEAYQGCRNAQIDHATPTVTDKQKQAWLDEGNSAVDEAHALAAAFSNQLKFYKTAHPDQAPPGAPAAVPNR